IPAELYGPRALPRSGNHVLQRWPGLTSGPQPDRSQRSSRQPTRTLASGLTPMPPPIAPTSNVMRLEDLISGIQGGRIRINQEYQRSGQIWPARAKSFLVATVLLGMPIPRVLLHVIDPKPEPPHQLDIID